MQPNTSSGVGHRVHHKNWGKKKTPPNPKQRVSGRRNPCDVAPFPQNQALKRTQFRGAAPGTPQRTLLCSQVWGADDADGEGRAAATHASPHAKRCRARKRGAAVSGMPAAGWTRHRDGGLGARVRRRDRWCGACGGAAWRVRPPSTAGGGGCASRACRRGGGKQRTPQTAADTHTAPRLADRTG